MAPPNHDNAAVGEMTESDSGSDVQPLANPPPNHELLTRQYESRHDLEDALYDFTARAGYNIYRLRSSNKWKDFGYTQQSTLSTQRESGLAPSILRVPSP